MLLSLTTTHQPATDLGYLLGKHPDKLQYFELSFGQGIVFYPVASVEHCSVCLLVEIDPVRLVRTPGNQPVLKQYVNDRPYVASSFLSVAIAKIFRSALGGTCKENPTLAETPLPLTAKIAALPCYGGETLLRRLFEPLGYSLTVEPHLFDGQFPEWENSPYFTVEMQQTITLQTLLSHLYVLIPVLDAEKHYWIGDEEVEKLLRHGSSWLATHPEQELITKRYLKYQKRLVRSALEQLAEDNIDSDEILVEQEKAEENLEKSLTLNQQRLETVVSTIKQLEAKKVIDLGCGEGKLLKLLSKELSLTEIVGMDVSYRSLEIAKDKLKLDRLPPKQQEKIKLFQGGLTYRDKRLNGYDVATVIEVIEHLDQPRLQAFEKVLFQFAQPNHVIVTTPNIEYNINFEALKNGQLRHNDHRFEWTRKEFQDWSQEIGTTYGYSVKFYPIGTEDPSLGSPTQMALFTKV